jgi:hypothetical protein
MLWISWVAAQLAASQEELSSMSERYTHVLQPGDVLLRIFPIIHWYGVA